MIRLIFTFLRGGLEAVALIAFLLFLVVALLAAGVIAPTPARPSPHGPCAAPARVLPLARAGIPPEGEPACRS